MNEIILNGHRRNWKVAVAIVFSNVSALIGVFEEDYEYVVILRFAHKQ